MSEHAAVAVAAPLLTDEMVTLELIELRPFAALQMLFSERSRRRRRRLLEWALK